MDPKKLLGFVAGMCSHSLLGPDAGVGVPVRKHCVVTAFRGVGWGSEIGRVAIRGPSPTPGEGPRLSFCVLGIETWKDLEERFRINILILFWRRTRSSSCFLFVLGAWRKHCLLVASCLDPGLEKG